MPAAPERSWAALLPDDIVRSAGFDRAFRGLQAFRWISRGAASWSDMTDLPEQERKRLDDSSPLISSSVSARLSDPDGTIKLALRLHDGAIIECVALSDSEGRRTACLSTQVGCPMACAFCKTGSLGFQRDLSASEIVEQLLFLNREGGPASNVVFMGMGEPLLNIAELRAAIEVIRHPEGLNMGSRKITISTSGLVEGIIDLARNGPRVRLAVSLTSGDSGMRGALMPVEKSNPLPRLKEALLEYQAESGDRITLETVLLGGTNTGRNDARAIADFSRGLSVQVNVIPWNPVEGLGFRQPGSSEIEGFIASLEGFGLTVTRRARRGRGVSGACGQLGALSEPAEF